MELLKKEQELLVINGLRQELTKEILFQFRRKTPEEIQLENKKIEMANNLINNFNSGMVHLNNKIEQLNAVQSDISNKVSELHAIQTGKLYQPKTRISKKEKQDIELQQMRKNAHNRVLNR